MVDLKEKAMSIYIGIVVDKKSLQKLAKDLKVTKSQLYNFIKNDISNYISIQAKHEIDLALLSRKNRGSLK